MIGQPAGVSTVSASDHNRGLCANKYLVATVSLTGKHDLKLIRGGGSLRPGDKASTVIDGGLLEPVAAERESVASVAPSAWHTLCGRRLDWVEVS
jgi:hypothetical protein